jgi:non-specific serine/threonine protein kinase
MTRIELPQPLTQREEQVAALLARGWSARKVAEHLHISERTVAGHVEAIALRIPGDLPAQARIVCWWRGATKELLCSTP